MMIPNGVGATGMYVLQILRYCMSICITLYTLNAYVELCDFGVHIRYSASARTYAVRNKKVFVRAHSPATSGENAIYKPR
jgi:hypothetical protein